MSEVRVLIVDDDEAVLEAMPAMLRLRLPDISVDTCANAPTAIEHLQTRTYDAIVSDIKMPGMDGLALLARARELCPNTPIIMVTGHGDADLVIHALRGGAYDFIEKPIEREYFVSALQRATEVCVLRREVEAQHATIARHMQHLEDEVAARTRDLTRANAAKDEFLGLVSHELRTPITVISGNAEVLQRKNARLTEEERAEALSDIQREADRLNRIVENMFLLARRARHEAVALEPVLLQRLIQAAVDHHHKACPAREILLDVQSELPVLAHPGYVEIVVGNLISNAEKYSRTDTPITIRVKQDAAMVAVSVLDCGAGVPPEELEAIFQPFYRAKGTARIAPGVGIGLAVCRELVEAQGGEIKARRTSEGTEFSFTLQLVPLEPDHAQDPAPADAAAVLTR